MRTPDRWPVDAGLAYNGDDEWRFVSFEDAIDMCMYESSRSMHNTRDAKHKVKAKVKANLL